MRKAADVLLRAQFVLPPTALGVLVVHQIPQRCRVGRQFGVAAQVLLDARRLAGLDFTPYQNS
jgi:hypothetical protein